MWPNEQNEGGRKKSGQAAFCSSQSRMHCHVGNPAFLVKGGSAKLVIIIIDITSEFLFYIIAKISLQLSCEPKKIVKSGAKFFWATFTTWLFATLSR